MYIDTRDEDEALDDIGYIEEDLVELVEENIDEEF